MESSPKFLDPQTLAKLHGLQLRAKRIVEGFVAGLHRSPYRGFSVEFAEHREYVPGDDIRHLDWKVFGRTDKFYLKQYEDETNLICYVVLDVSESMTYKGPDSPLSKLEYAQCIAAAISWLVLQHQDAVGLATFDNQIREYVPPSNSPARLNELLDVMEQAETADKTEIGTTFEQLAEKLNKRGVVLVISDLFDETRSLLNGLCHLCHQQHDVAVLHVLDPAELELPFDRPTQFRGLESTPTVTTQPRAIRTAYQSEINNFLQQVKRGCLENQIDYRLIATDQALDVALSAFLTSRR